MNEGSAYPELMELMGYMITSARGLLDEPQAYGPLRLVEGVSRLCSALEGYPGANRLFLADLKDRVDAHKFDVMLDPPTFAAMLDDAVALYTTRLKQGWE